MNRKQKFALLTSVVALPALYAASLTEAGVLPALKSAMLQTAERPVPPEAPDFSQPVVRTAAAAEKAVLEPGYDAMAINAIAPAATPEPDINGCSFEEKPQLQILESATVSFGGEATPYRAPASKAPGKGVAGKFISRDASVNGVNLGALLTVENYGSTTDTLTVANLYEWGADAKVKMAVNEAAGTIAIPQQTLGESAYGNVDVVAISISSDGKYSIPKDRTIRGTINEKGEVTIGPWAVVALDEASKSVKATFNIFSSSSWAVPNANFKGTDAANGSALDYPMLVEQIAPNEIVIYHLIDGLTATVSGRLTTGGKIMVSPQQVAMHSLYGPFYIYGINASGKPDTSNAIVLSPAADGSVSFPGFFVAAQQSSSTLLRAVADVTITGNYSITFPKPESSDFKGSGTAADPWIISTYQDLTALSQSVENGTSYEGQHFALGADLDLSNVPVTEYVPVGNATSQFAATFDGRGHTIKGLRVDGKGFPHIGIFGYISTKGTVKNLVVDNFMAIGSGDEIGCVAGRCEGLIEGVTVKNSILQTNGLLTGGICGALLNGTVRNSSFHGRLTGMGSVAGIVGQGAESTIEGCSVQGQFTIDGFVSEKARDMGGIAGVFSKGNLRNCVVSGTLADAYGRSATGGLVGRLLNGGNVENCLNTAAISGRRLNSETSSYAGGLFGMCMSAIVKDCMNSGTIIMAGENNNVGGLAGQLAIVYVHSGINVNMDDESYFTNCYNSGQITSSSDNGSKGLYGYAFYEEGYRDKPEDICFINCFFDQQVNFYQSEKFGRNTSAITGKIPEGYSSDVWTVTSGNYPVLKEFASTPAGKLATVALVLREGQDANKVKFGFRVTSKPDVEWCLEGELGNTESESLTMGGNMVTVKDIYATAIIAATTTDGLGMKLYRLAVVPKVFDGEGTAASPYLLKTVDDFVKLNEALTVHLQPHAGDFFLMANDIDFKDSSFKGFGFGTLINTEFRGTFDGGNHFIHNLNLNMATYKADGDFDPACPNGYNGLFNQLGKVGTIRNVNIAADCRFDFNIFSAPLVAFNKGRVENCRNYADVKGHQRQIGGLVGVNYNGVIDGCYNAGNVVCGINEAAGIAAFNYDSGLISASQNDGDISVRTTCNYNSKESKNSVGGITSDNYGTVENCVNNGQISGEEIVGGIAAYTVASYLIQNPNNPQKPIEVQCFGIVRNSINNGQINCSGQVSTRGAIIGQRGSSKEISGNYYDGSINLTGGMQSNDIEGTVPLSTSELTSGKSIGNLSADLFDFKAGAYPVLKAFAAEEATKALRSIYVNFTAGQMRTNIRENVALSQADGLNWSLKVNDGFKINGSQLTVTPPTGTTVIGDTLTASLSDKYVKTYLINSVPVVFAGEGTAADPYRIENKADWKKLADFVEATGWEYMNSHFIVTNDIDFEGDSIRPVAFAGVRFQGNLDGNGKTLKGFIYDNPNGYANRIDPVNPNKFVAKGTGLFGSIGNAGTVRNLTIDGTIKGHSEIGGIAAHVYGTVENCVNKGLVGTNSSNGVGGIAYRLWDGGVIRECVNEGSVIPDNGNDAGQTAAAGIVHITSANSLVENCYNRGTVGHKAKGGVAGIAYTCMGTLRGCVNEKTLAGPSNLYGVVYSISSNGILENCGNTADFNCPAGSNIFGVFNTAAEGGNGYIKGAFNTGNITAKNICGGVGNSCYMAMTDCYNTGNITSTNQRATGVVSILGVLSKSESSCDRRLVSSGLYNTGDITSAYLETAGVAANVKAFMTLTDSYNTGNITQKHNGLCAGGVAATGDGRLERCFNTGDVYSWGHCTGGVWGRPGNNKIDWESGLFNCFNLGNVTVDSKLTSNSVYGAAGGLAGSTLNGELSIAECFNAGDVKANDVSGKCKMVWAGGLIGNVLTHKVKIRDCYNTGAVACSDPATTAGRRSFTIGANADKFWVKPDSVPFDGNWSNIYYDVKVNSGKADREVEGSGIPTSQLVGLTLSGFNASTHGGYPALTAFAADHEAMGIANAAIRLTDEKNDTHAAVKHYLTLHAPAGTVWKEEGTSGCLEIADEKAYPKAVGSTVLSCTSPEGHQRLFALTISEGFNDGVEQSVDVREIESILYIDTQGRVVAVPEPGNVYVVRTVFTDGTVETVKTIVK